VSIHCLAVSCYELGSVKHS